ncbi:DNA mismatch repair endonuclease MutL [Sphaerochaeta globosa]|uniref:DNA mismatch repair protein MutL n=1 Tax=Sphaerochaeta globosa (strain ATCC BAA-1886 / DSM 22777 / Buddy) TaxID=158189 RepID=F0RWA4_SPHGB|nr:DNA mismatch repair endonuclease MutL [Sphaerochaeta globosa]ADY13461.1 DNA mismatch repair protein mutL [Sphaerochaeta globosa str. Buddy]
MKIKLLDPLVAQRIAAGEVIERPASVIRELLDNALDAGSKSIVASVIEGGLEEIKVIDDGEGIEREDLPLLCESHATSKVRELDDLYHIKSMGFRGEALYSIASVSRITIASSFQGQEPYQITVDNGRKEAVLPGGPRTGTMVTVEGLFKELPARRQFLKRPSTEATMARAVLLEKALAFPDRAFRFISDQTVRVDLVPTTRKQRVLDVLLLNQNIVSSEMLELYDSAGRFDLYAVCSSPAFSRSDRSHIKIYVNNRPVDEYSLVQAVTYGYGELLAGGSFPYCYLFIDVDPTLVDFNIHPTKREVKLRNKAEIHHQVVSMIASQIKRTIPRLVKQELEAEASPLLAPLYETKPSSYQASERSNRYEAPSQKAPLDSEWFQKARELLEGNRMQASRTTESQDIWAEQEDEQEFIYLGQAFNLFLVAQKKDDLFLVDQHAAHERLIFDEVREKKNIQQLMIPLSFEVERDVDTYLLEHQDVYLNLGIKLERTEDLLWQISSLPGLYRNIEAQLVSFIQKTTGDTQEVEKGLYAVVACHAAIKAGDTVDRMMALSLLTKVFQLDEPTCPHGRTFVVRLNKEELMKAVQRT